VEESWHACPNPPQPVCLHGRFPTSELSRFLAARELSCVAAGQSSWRTLASVVCARAVYVVKRSDRVLVRWLPEVVQFRLLGYLAPALL
jgi:hypothetical protein